MPPRGKFLPSRRLEPAEAIFASQRCFAGRRARERDDEEKNIIGGDNTSLKLI